jgi:hypothetical protein
MTRVAIPEFVFVVQLSGCRHPHEVLNQVAENVFSHVGCTAATVSELASQLSSAIAGHLAAAEELQVAFHAHPGSCDVIVTARDREVWRMTRGLP